ncbi:MAG: L-2-hydroxyglutarate oxidase [Chloroflexi bacterium]|nr:L-2-hydroxyglutarate oxidase [Chloroflexota bacterium]MCI0801931.1 L-2-hydroxyglutarate oxidase [Chloroflexota bacterium]MCI0829031.1 L-2-hydroxyglutarate oxidase [Chloroflexota bacterium]
MESSQYDIAIIGGGILGLSTAMQLLERVPSWRVAVLEKEENLATHQTGHNSGVMHSGIYYRPGSQKAQFCVAGRNNMVRFCEENEIEFQQCGKVIVALNESELGRLQDLYERGTANGVPDLEIVGPERLKEIEPYTVGVRALWAPHTGIVDFSKVAAAFAGKFQQAGGDIFTGALVRKITHSSGSLALETTKGTLQAKHLINCAGLYADKVASMTGEKVGIRIIPFRGEYYTLRPESHHMVSGLIYPVPDPQFPFLGVHFTRNIKGHVEAGPNAVMALRREGYRKRDFSLGDSLGNLAYPGFWKMAFKFWKIGLGEVYRSYNKRVFLRDLQRLLPDIKDSDLAGGGSGVRAQAVARDGSLLDDFSIIQGRGAIHVLNAPSPGATSSLAIGEHIAGLALENFGAPA